MIRVEGVLLSLSLCTGTLACNRTPDDLREWRPIRSLDITTETTPESEQGSPQVSGSAESPRSSGWTPSPSPRGVEPASLATASWGAVTAPKGPMLQARDLSDPAWQRGGYRRRAYRSPSRRAAAECRRLRFPPATLEGLVHLVRLLNRDRAGLANATRAPGASDAGTPRAGAHAGSGK